VTFFIRHLQEGVIGSFFGTSSIYSLSEDMDLSSDILESCTITLGYFDVIWGQLTRFNH
jgi:hypothetical protein